MKLYNGFSPNGARVAIFVAEKGLDLPVETIDIFKGETRTEAFREINSLGQVPVLELDDGRRLCESIAICRYLDHLYPNPPLFGTGAEDQAFVEMWTRRMELWLFNVAADVPLHRVEIFKDIVEQNADYAASRARAFDKRLVWFDRELSDGRPFVTGPSFSIADIVGMTMLIVTRFMGMKIPQSLTHVKRWENAVVTRPSFPAMPQAA